MTSPGAENPAWVCPNCGHYGWPTRATRGSLLVEFLLWLFFLLPGIIYSAWRMTTRFWTCASCSQPGVVGAATPRGLQLMQQYHLHGGSVPEAHRPGPLPASQLVIPEILWTWRWGFAVAFAIAALFIAGLIVVDARADREVKARSEADAKYKRVLERYFATLAVREERFAAQAEAARQLESEQRRMQAEQQAAAQLRAFDEEAARLAEAERQERVASATRLSALLDEQERQRRAAEVAGARARKEEQARRTAAIRRWHSEKYLPAVASFRAAADRLGGTLTGTVPVTEFAAACREVLQGIEPARRAAGQSGDEALDAALQLVFARYREVGKHCTQGRQFETRQALMETRPAFSALASELGRHGLKP